MAAWNLWCAECGAKQDEARRLVPSALSFEAHATNDTSEVATVICRDLLVHREDARSAKGRGNQCDGQTDDTISLDGRWRKSPAEHDWDVPFPFSASFSDLKSPCFVLVRVYESNRGLAVFVGHDHETLPGLWIRHRKDY
jgi:hypothetical protein